MAITAVVGARNVASRFARSEDSVVAFLAAIGNNRVIHTSRFPAVGPVATVALQPQVGNVPIRWRRSRTAPGPIVAVVALGGGSAKQAIAMTGVALDARMCTHEGEACSEVVEIIGLGTGLQAD